MRRMQPAYANCRQRLAVRVAGVPARMELRRVAGKPIEAIMGFRTPARAPTHPTSKRPEPQEAIRREIRHQLLAQQILQRLGSAAAEGAVARAAIEPRYRELVGEAVAAV